MRLSFLPTRILGAFIYVTLAAVAQGAAVDSTGPATPADRFLLGHTDGVMSVAFFPDNRLAVSCGMDRTIRVWDTNNGRLIRTITGHLGPVWSVAVSSDGKQIASSSSDHTVRVWDAATGDQIAQLEGHVGEVRGVAYLPDGSLISGGRDGLRIWDPKTEKLLWKSTDAPAVSAMAVSQNGARCAYTALAGVTHVWDLAAHKHILEVGEFTGLYAYSGSLALSPDGKTLYAHTQSTGGTLGIWDVDSGRQLPIRGSDIMNTVTLPPDGKYVVVEANGVAVNDSRTGKLVARFDSNSFHAGQGEFMHCVAISPDGTRVLCGGGGNFNANVWQHGINNVISFFTIPDPNLTDEQRAALAKPPLPPDGAIEYRGSAVTFLFDGMAVSNDRGQIRVSDIDLHWKLEPHPRISEQNKLIGAVRSVRTPAQLQRIGISVEQLHKSFDTISMFDRVEMGPKQFDSLFNAFYKANDGPDKDGAAKAVMNQIHALADEQEKVAAQNIAHLKSTLTAHQLEEILKGT